MCVIRNRIVCMRLWRAMYMYSNAHEMGDRWRDKRRRHRRSSAGEHCCCNRVVEIKMQGGGMPEAGQMPSNAFIEKQRYIG